MNLALSRPIRRLITHMRWGFNVSITSNDGILKGIMFIEDEFSFADMLDVFADIFDTAVCRSFSIVPEQDYFDEVSPNPSKILNII